MSAKKENKDKIKMSRLISNVFYILKYAMKHNSFMVISYILCRCVFMGIGAFIDTFLLKEIIDIFTTTADYESVIKVLVLMFTLHVVRMVIFRLLENIFWTKMIGFEGTIQRELMAKAQLIDLK